MSVSHESAVLGVEAGGRRYAVTPAQIDHIGLLDPQGEPSDPRGQRLIFRDLGPLLGGDATAAVGRHHAITVSLRRRSVALIIDQIDSLDGEGPLETQPLAPLLSRHLARPWFLGAVVYRGKPLLLLDLRRIATDVAIGAV